MAAMAAKGPSMSSSDEVESMACRKAIEFAIDVGFSKLLNVVDDVRHLLLGLQWVTICCTRRRGNRVALVLA